ncbi:MAG: 5'/3'-nucleotidase SurE [Anaerolineae bacterium]
MHILITNDDGVDASGLFILQKALQEVGEVTVFTPDHNWSAAGHTKTMHKPLRVNQTTLPDGTMAYTSNGAPSDCVALAVLGILPRKPDLVVSGINQGANLGQDITYSGTVAAAMEAVIFGMPAIAVSLDSYESEDFAYAARFAARLVTLVLERGLPPTAFLNVNVPAVPQDEIAGIRITCLGRRVYRDALVERRDPRGRSYYWIGGQPPRGVDEEGTDIWALANNYVSITPLHLDMTQYQMMEELRQWGLEA